MNGIDTLLNEHENILIFIGIARKYCCKILDGEAMDTNIINDMHKFGQIYADKQHHIKEEVILFRKMLDNMGDIAINLIQHGMIVEHDLGRLCLKNLEIALKEYSVNHKTIDKLQIITELTSYTNLLQRHIDKENDAIYPFASRSLSQSILEEVDKETEEYENNLAANRDEGMELLEKLVKQVG